MSAKFIQNIEAVEVVSNKKSSYCKIYLSPIRYRDLRKILNWSKLRIQWVAFFISLDCRDKGSLAF